MPFPSGITKKPCIHFFSSRGCRFGDNCKFDHVKRSESNNNDNNNNQVPDISSSSSSSSSDDDSHGKSSKAFPRIAVEDELGVEDSPFQLRPPSSTKEQRKRKSGNSSSHEKNPFQVAAAGANNPNKKAKISASHYKSMANDAEELLPSPPSPTPRPDSNKEKEQGFRGLNLPVASFSVPNEKEQHPNPSSSSNNDSKRETTPNHHQNHHPPSSSSSRSMEKHKNSPPKQGFRALNLPIASFSIPDDKTKEAKEDKSHRERNVHHHPTKSSTLPLNVVPKSHPEGMKWAWVVEQTQQSPRFASDFDFDKYKNQDQDNGVDNVRSTSDTTWTKFRPYGSWCADNPQVIAMDCEMCETTDPQTGKRNPRALCRLSVTDALTDEVLLDTLVKPSWPVTEYRTFINGITADDLEHVEFTLSHAQAFMSALCSRETVVIGHAVHNDFVALRIEHTCVADSVHLFTCADPDRLCISLKDLYVHLYQKTMPKTHDSVNDARVALACVKYYMEKNGEVDPVPTSPLQYKFQLFVHRIPKGICNESHLFKMILEYTDIQPKEVEDIEFSSEKAVGKTVVVFRTPRHASLAFESLFGNAVPDKTGRLQKKVYLKNKDYIFIRKMLNEKEGRNKQQQQQKHRDNNKNNDGRQNHHHHGRENYYGNNHHDNSSRRSY